MKVVCGYDNLGLAGGNALDDFAPLASSLERSLDRLGAGVHRKRHLIAGKFVEVAVEQGKLIVAEGARSEGHFLRLTAHCLEDGGVTVSLIDSRISGEKI